MEPWAVVAVAASVATAAIHVSLLRRERRDARALARYRALFEDSDAPVVVVEPGTAVLLDANPAAAAFYGRPVGELIGTPAWELSASGETETRERIAKSAVAPRVFEAVHRAAGGEKRDVEVHACPVTDGGRTVVLSTIHDVTERRRNAAELERYRRNLESLVQARTAALVEANRRLRAASEAKSEFLANMSHELRTPLNSIIGFSGTMLGGLAGPLNDEQRRQSEMILRSGRHLLGLVDGVLDLARIEAGTVSVAYDEIDLAEVVREATESVRPLADHKRLSLRAECPGGRLMARTDPLKVRQILINLLGNAIKFTDAGEVGIEVLLEGDEAHIEVRDTGCGIPRDRQEAIFEEFRQLDVPGIAKPAGSGLGLTVSRAMAEMLGGRIEVHSVVGEGSLFTLVLPLDPVFAHAV